LVHNLAEGLEAFLLRQRAALHAAAAGPGEATAVASDSTPGTLTPSRPRHGQQRGEDCHNGMRRYREIRQDLIIGDAEVYHGWQDTGQII